MSLITMARFVMISFVVCCSFDASSAFPRVQRREPNSKSIRIVGGEEADQGQFPYQLFIRNMRGDMLCGGALVEVKGMQVVLTTASCVDEENTDELEVVGGDLERSDISGFEQTHRVSHKIVHENYDGRFAYNIAVLLLACPFEINENVCPIALPVQGQPTTGDVIISGWGVTEPESPLSRLSDRLRFVRIPIVDDLTCQEAYFPDDIVLENMLCTGLVGVGGKDSCDGDAGGPVVSVDGNYLAGLVDWGIGCGDPNYPGVNTEVSYFIDWINQAVQVPSPTNNTNSDFGDNNLYSIPQL